jgi:hypothetical protein
MMISLHYDASALSAQQGSELIDDLVRKLAEDCAASDEVKSAAAKP